MGGMHSNGTLKNNETETINWNDINTDNVSTHINLKHGLSHNAKDLLNKLNNFVITETEVNTNNTTANTTANINNRKSTTKGR